MQANNLPEQIILIVDDQLANLKVLAKILKDNNYKVKKAIDGETALIAVETEQPDLILLDIKMPKLDGYEVCKILKLNPQTQEIPIIFISALNDVFDKIKAFEVGGIDYITKPFQEAEVLARIKNQLIIQYQKKLLQEEIIKRKKVELDLEQANKDLEAFSYRVAHDLRNPLGSVQGFIEVIKIYYQYHENQEILQYLEFALRATTKMNQIIDDLLTLSHIKQAQIQRELVDLSTVFKELLNQIQINEPSRKVELIIADKITAIGDKGLLTIALENLINNAWKYSSKKDITRIEFGILSPEHQELETIIKQCLLFCKEKLLCQNLDTIYFIKDNGVGFNMEKADKLFTPFHRLHSQSDFPGTGIGLSIVQRIIIRHGGLIWCNSETNQGTTFYFTLKM